MMNDDHIQRDNIKKNFFYYELKAIKSDYGSITKEKFLSLSTEKTKKLRFKVMAEDMLIPILQCIKPPWTWK